MGNQHGTSFSNSVNADPSVRIEELMNQERQTLDKKLAELKGKPNPEFVQTKIEKYQKSLHTLNYFETNGGIIEAKERHTKKMQEAQRQLQESQKINEKLRQQNNNCLVNNVNIQSQLANSISEQQQANNAINQLSIQYETKKTEFFQKKMEQDQNIMSQQQDNNKLIEQLKQIKQQNAQIEQDQVRGLNEKAQEKIDEIEKKHADLQSEYAEIQKEYKSFYDEKQQKEQEHQQNVELIKKNSTDQNNKSLLELENRLKQDYNQTKQDWDSQKKNYNEVIFKLNQEYNDLEDQLKKKEILEAAQLNKIKGLKKQLQELNPDQEITPTQIEFVKQFKVVEEEKPTIEQVKVIEKKHQEVEKILLKWLKKYRKKPLSSVSDEEKKKMEGYQGVFLMHTMLAQQGITSYFTDKPMYQLEQSSKAVYQQKIIQCGIHNSSSYYIANYASVNQMETLILESKSLQNFIQKFKNDMVQKIGDKDITPQDFQVFAVTTQPPSIQFQISSTSAQKINIQKLNFCFLGFDVETQNLIDKAELPIDMFEPIHNRTWENLTKKSDFRGALQFKNQNEPTPQIYNYPLGYQGLGLKVLDKYGEDQRWIRADTRPDTWIVLYHGTGYKNLKGILDQNNIKPGKNNVYGGKQCRITGTIIKSGEFQNTYLADNVIDAEPYSIRLNKQDNVPYSLVFQCRVNPKKIKSPVKCPTYYTIENPFEDIRPYRLLIKKIDK